MTERIDKRVGVAVAAARTGMQTVAAIRTGCSSNFFIITVTEGIDYGLGKESVAIVAENTVIAGIGTSCILVLLHGVCVDAIIIIKCRDDFSS